MQVLAYDQVLNEDIQPGLATGERLQGSGFRSL